MRLKVILPIMLFFWATLAGAHETAIVVGGSFLPSTTENAETPAGPVSFSTYDKTGFYYGFDEGWSFSQKWGISAIVEATNYSYSGGGPGDTVGFLGIAPKYITYSNAGTKVWEALGLGLAVNKLGEASSASDGLFISALNTNADAFGVSPRVGMDVRISPHFKIRFQLAYTLATFRYNVDFRNYPSMTEIGRGTISGQRSFATAALGIVFNY
ncbi:MAG: hypothetical protein KGL39_33150 [Patescibacteria group bacterium]|nr:hypothetical protein [Patescibacteria group bacterium]